MNGRGTPVEVARTLGPSEVYCCLALVRRLREAVKSGQVLSNYGQNSNLRTLDTLEWYLGSMLATAEEDEEEEIDEDLETASSENDIPF